MVVNFIYNNKNALISIKCDFLHFKEELFKILASKKPFPNWYARQRNTESHVKERLKFLKNIMILHILGESAEQWKEKIWQERYRRYISELLNHKVGIVAVSHSCETWRRLSKLLFPSSFTVVIWKLERERFGYFKTKPCASRCQHSVEQKSVLTNQNQSKRSVTAEN